MGRPKLGYRLRRDRGERCYLHVHGYAGNFAFETRDPSQAEITDAIAAIKAGAPAQPAEAALQLAPETDTLRALADAYYRWSKVTVLDPQTQQTRRNAIEQLLASRTPSGRPRAQVKVYDLTRKHVQAIQDEYAARGTPAQGNKVISYLGYLFTYAIKVDWPGVVKNPCEALDRLPPKVKINPNDEAPYTGHREWTLAEADRFLDFYRDEAQPFLAVSLMLHTGLRISDARKIGQSMEKVIDWRGTKVRCLVYDITKGAQKRAREGKPKLQATVPIVPQFAEALKRAPDISPTYLLNEHGNRWKSAKTLDRRMRKWLDAVVDEDGSQPFKELSSHGLRYTAANWWAATYRCTPHELMAIFGWLKVEQAMKYTQRYDREDSAAGVVVRFPRQS